MSNLRANNIYDLNGGSNAQLYGIASPVGSMGFRNRILNGDMRLDQRNVGAAVTTDGAFPVDRFSVGKSNDGAYSAQRSTTAPAGFTNSLQFTTTTADSSLAAGQFQFVVQRVEGFNVADLGWGASGAQSVTLSFWVRSSLTGTFGGAIQNSGASRSYPFTYAISAANTWEQKSVTIPGDTSGTWLTNNGVGLSLVFGLGVGSTYSGTAGAWASADYQSATGAVSVIGTLNATWYITGVQLEVGTFQTAPTFERVEYGAMLRACQRYFEKSFDTNQAPAHNTGEFIIHPNSGALGCGGNTYLSILFKVSKRARSGTLRLYDPFAAHTSTENWWRSFTNNCGGGTAIGPNAGFALDVYENFMSGYGQNFTDGGVCFHWTVSSEL
jgi:hypothetical protein